MEATIRKLYDSARSLMRMPNRDRLGQKDGTRELIMAPVPYISVYGVEPDHLSHPSRRRRTVRPATRIFRKIGPREFRA